LHIHWVLKVLAFYILFGCWSFLEKWIQKSFKVTTILAKFFKKLNIENVLLHCCFGKPGAQHQGEDVFLIGEQQGNVPFLDKDIDKGLLTLLKLDKFGFQIWDLQGLWIVVDVDLGPQNMVLYSWLILYQATGGYLNLAVHWIDNNSNNNVTIVVGQRQGLSIVPYGRCSIKFKFMPWTSAILHCFAMTIVGQIIGNPFQ